MRVTIDAAGRLVIPKPLREELGLHGPAEVELSAQDGRIELAVADVPAHVEEPDGFPLIAAERPMPPMSAEETRAAVERVRR